ncbi:MAG: hypothetical protein Q8P18_15410 [Pseudomonadota bacterium]|nr:hypothetical protein [Pseudomonadota bacterium]
MKSRSGGGAAVGAAVFLLAAGTSPSAYAWEIVRSIDQPEQRDASGRVVTVEASIIHVIACNGEGENGGQYYLYGYLNRSGFRAIQPPDWGHPIGGRDFSTENEAAVAACSAGMAPLPGPAPGACGIGVQWDVVDTDGAWSGVWTRRGDSTLFDGYWQTAVGGGAEHSALLDIQVTGDQVVIHRTDPPNQFQTTDCTYQGKITADGSKAEGTVTCNSGVGVLGPHTWHATIRCEPTVDPLPPTQFPGDHP